MNFRVTLVFLAVFALLAGAVWYLEPSEESETAQNAELTVLDLRPEEIRRVEVVDQGKTVALERGDDDTWRIAAPESAEADDLRVDDAVSRLASLKATRRLEGAGDLATYGLENPNARIELTTQDGASSTVLIGSKTPDDAGYYVKRADAPTVYVVSGAGVSDLLRWVAEPPRPRPTPPPPTPASSPTAAPAKP